MAYTADIRCESCGDLVFANERTSPEDLERGLVTLVADCQKCGHRHTYEAISPSEIMRLAIPNGWRHLTIIPAFRPRLTPLQPSSLSIRKGLCGAHNAIFASNLPARSTSMARFTCVASRASSSFRLMRRYSHHQPTRAPSTSPNQALQRTAPAVTLAAPPPAPAQPSRQPPPSLSLWSFAQPAALLALS
jgi:hypothetical protein